MDSWNAVGEKKLKCLSTEILSTTTRARTHSSCGMMRMRGLQQRIFSNVLRVFLKIWSPRNSNLRAFLRHGNNRVLKCSGSWFDFCSSGAQSGSHYTILKTTFSCLVITPGFHLSPICRVPGTVTRREQASIISANAFGYLFS